MNVNQLLHDHQVASIMAQYAHSRVDRVAHGKRVDEHARRITDWRRSAGLSSAGWPIELSAYRAADA